MKPFFSRKRLKRIRGISLLVILSGYLIPEKFSLPVAGMDSGSFNHASYWYYPWGKSICHKGVDIFADKGTAVYAASGGWVVNISNHPRGGKLVHILGPKWHIHHYLHLDTILTKRFQFVSSGELIGKVGNTGNAAHKPSHLHYTISTPIPYIWQADKGRQGYKKIWFIDPTPYLLQQLKS